MNPMDWIRENRCPSCVHGGGCKGYVVKRSHEGWRCCGFASRYADMRPGDYMKVVAR